MNLGFVLSSAQKDLRRRARDPAALAVWLGLPLVIASLILLAFGGEDKPPVARVLVNDQDGSLAGELLVNALEQSPVIEVEKVADETARAQIEAGKATALLIIPKDFGQAVLNEQPTTLRLLTNPAQRILPGLVEENLSLSVDAVFYLQRLFGSELREMAAGPPPGQLTYSNETVMALSSNMNQTVQRVLPYLAPLAIQLETTTEVRDTGMQLGLGALFFPGILFMALLFMASGMAGDVWHEAEAGTIRRAIMTPQAMSDFLAGKLLAGGVLIAAVCLTALVIGVWAFKVPLARAPLGLLWAVFTGVVFLATLMLIQLYSSSARTAGTFTTMIIFPLLMVGGSFFPFESMPAGLASIGRLTPNGWALTQLKAILWGGAEPVSLAIASAGLLVVFLFAFSLSARRLRRGFVGR